MREMKDSGIEWIGTIPKEWSVIRLCYLIGGYKAGPFGSALIMDKLADEGDILVYTPEIIAENRTDLPNNKYLQEERLKEMEQFVVQKDDIIFPIVGSLGRAMLITEDMPTGIINQRLSKFHLTSEVLFIDYFLWLFAKSSFYAPFIDVSCRGSIIVNLTKAILHDMPVIIPSIKEQKTISKYLDSKCLEIDSVISDIQSQIEALEEYKKSLVFRVVSKGFKKSALKATTSEVWTNIPENWKLVDIKYVFEIVKRIAGQEGFDVLSVTQRGLKVKDIESNNGQQAESYAGYQFVYPTDYVMNHMDLLTGWVDCSTMFGVTSPDYRVFRLHDKKNNDLTYFKYLMQCCYMSRIFYSLGQGVSNLGRWRLQTSAFNNFMIPVPPLDEQREIAEYLDNKIMEIEGIIADKQKQIKTIEEYKKSLIFEYVTGKKEVEVETNERQ